MFRDREDAGRRLAERLAEYRDEDPVVLALPRGGVPVAYEISLSLGAPLDVLVARKLGALGREEFGIGAVAQGGVCVPGEDAIWELGIPEGYIERITKKETEEIWRRLALLRGDRPEPEVGGRTAILVDDGLATGVTARAAIEAIRRQKTRAASFSPCPCAPSRRRRPCAPRSTSWSAWRRLPTLRPSASGTKTSTRCPMMRSSNYSTAPGGAGRKRRDRPGRESVTYGGA